ncbi:hypothetical protein ACH4E5_20040 [Streptomyces afghaniensis]|uniref:hypothetical protein n=1 Tax=Streptomyces afghaniensis TaxID=66865 RepID=UPI0037BBD435
MTSTLTVRMPGIRASASLLDLARGEFIHPDTVPGQTALVAGLLTRLAEPLQG